MALPEFLLGPVLPVLASTAAIYAYVVLLLRGSGNRTLAKLRAFDFVVTIALGTLLASVATLTVPFAQGAVAITALVGLQWLVAWATNRSARFHGLVTTSPRLLFYDGHYLEDEMRRARVAHPEIVGAMRGSGRGNELDVLAVVLEATGDLTVVGRSDDARPTSHGSTLRSLPPSSLAETEVGERARRFSGGRGPPRPGA